MKRRRNRLEQAEETHRLEREAGCDHGMPPDDVFAEKDKPGPEWTEEEESKWKASRWGSEGEPE